MICHLIIQAAGIRRINGFFHIPAESKKNFIRMMTEKTARQFFQSHFCPRQKNNGRQNHSGRQNRNDSCRKVQTFQPVNGCRLNTAENLSAVPYGKNVHFDPCQNEIAAMQIGKEKNSQIVRRKHNVNISVPAFIKNIYGDKTNVPPRR